MRPTCNSGLVLCEPLYIQHLTKLKYTIQASETLAVLLQSCLLVMDGQMDGQTDLFPKFQLRLKKILYSVV